MRSLTASGVGLGLEGTASLSEALAINDNVTWLDLSGNNCRNDGCRILVEHLGDNTGLQARGGWMMTGGGGKRGETMLVWFGSLGRGVLSPPGRPFGIPPLVPLKLPLPSLFSGERGGGSFGPHTLTARLP